MSEQPKKLGSKTIIQSKIFRLESVALRFDSGAEVEFECIHHIAKEGVIVVPFTDNGGVLMAREYALGSDRYELTFPRGAIDVGESPLEAARREMQEEVGYDCHHLHYVKEATIAPNYMTQTCHIFVAKDLFPSPLPGDEPEPMQVIEVPVADVSSHPECTDSLALAALHLALETQVP